MRSPEATRLSRPAALAGWVWAPVMGLAPGQAVAGLVADGLVLVLVAVSSLCARLVTLMTAPHGAAGRRPAGAGAAGPTPCRRSSPC